MFIPNPHIFMGGVPSDYAVYIGKAGTYCTRHIASGKTIQSVSPAINSLGQTMLPIADIALGIVNVGLGVYNAYQIHKTHESIKSINVALHAQHRTLELLISNQSDLSHKIDILRKEMNEGFQRVIEEVKDVEARRFREEFELRIFKLFKAYQRFSNMLPNAFEGEQLIELSERAEDLQGWLKVQLKNNIAKGKPERLPLLIALVFSVRAKADAFESRSGVYKDFATSELEELKKQLSNEIFDFCEGSSLYALGVQMPEILTQYVLLNRSLIKGCTRNYSLGDSEVLFSQEELTWKDEMDSLREVFQENSDNSPVIKGKGAVHLKTLSDYDWYTRFAGEDPHTFDVHSRTSIALCNLLQKIGHPNAQDATIREKDLSTLKYFTLPDTSRKISSILKAEFNWETSPKLLSSLS